MYFYLNVGMHLSTCELKPPYFLYVLDRVCHFHKKQENHHITTQHRNFSFVANHHPHRRLSLPPPPSPATKIDENLDSNPLPHCCSTKEPDPIVPSTYNVAIHLQWLAFCEEWLHLVVLTKLPSCFFLAAPFAVPVDSISLTYEDYLPQYY